MTDWADFATEQVLRQQQAERDTRLRHTSQLAAAMILIRRGEDHDGLLEALGIDQWREVAGR